MKFVKVVVSKRTLHYTSLLSKLADFLWQNTFFQNEVADAGDAGYSNETTSVFKPLHN
jgi:hypothetical protein